LRRAISLPLDRERELEVTAAKEAAAKAQANVAARARGLARRHRLSVFYDAGLRLQMLCTMAVGGPPRAQINLWVDSVKHFLREHYGQTYVDRFMDAQSLLVAARLREFADERGWHDYVGERLARLQEITALTAPPAAD